MITVLTILTFPLPCMALWRLGDLSTVLDQPLGETSSTVPVAFESHSSSKPACEILLPEMFQTLRPHHGTIRYVATLSEPGPFTAQRAGSAFARGLVHGDDRWFFFTTSLFALMKEPLASDVFLDTGANHWVNAVGKIVAQPDNLDRAISAHTCSLDMVLAWSERLAACAVHRSDASTA